MTETNIRKAYRNRDFLLSKSARPIRILSEYLEPQSRLERFEIEDTIVVMGSARFVDQERAQAEYDRALENGEDLEEAERMLRTSRYYEDARTLSFRLTNWSKSLDDDSRRFVICTGGGPGIMEAANRGAHEAKGVNVGLAISLPFEEGVNPYITRELSFKFHYFFMRKFWFTYLAKAVILFPGGFGTLDELFEMLTLLQTRKIKKPLPVVLFGSEYWDRVFDMETLVEYGAISPKDLELVRVCDTVDDAYAYLTDQLMRRGMGVSGLSL